MNLSQPAKAKMHQDLARRLNALGENVGDPETFTHDERSGLRLLEAVVGRLEALAEKRKS